MHGRRGEIATLLTVGTLVVIGIATVVSSLNLGNKTSSSARAGSTCPANAPDQKSGVASQKNCTDLCGSYANFGGVQWLSEDKRTRICCCKVATAPVPLADPKCVSPNTVKSGTGDCSVQCNGVNNWAGTASTDGKIRKSCCKPPPTAPSCGASTQTCTGGPAKGSCCEGLVCTTGRCTAPAAVPPVTNKPACNYSSDQVGCSKDCTPNGSYYAAYFAWYCDKTRSCNSSSDTGSCSKACATVSGGGYGITFYCDKPPVVPEKTCATGTHLTGVPNQQNCSMVCEAKGGLYLSNTQWNSENNTVLNCCCKNVVAPPTDTSGGLYPQNNNGRTEGMACCFLQNGKVRIYASATARANNGMNTPCTTAVYGNTYGATSWFECPNDTVDGGAQVDYEAVNSPTCTVTGYTKTIANDGKPHCLDKFWYATCNGTTPASAIICPGNSTGQCVEDEEGGVGECKYVAPAVSPVVSPGNTGECNGPSTCEDYCKTKNLVSPPAYKAIQYYLKPNVADSFWEAGCTTSKTINATVCGCESTFADQGTVTSTAIITNKCKTDVTVHQLNFRKFIGNVSFFAINKTYKPGNSTTESWQNVCESTAWFSYTINNTSYEPSVNLKCNGVAIIDISGDMCHEVATTNADNAVVTDKAVTSDKTGCMTEYQCTSNPNCGTCAPNQGCGTYEGGKQGWLCTPKTVNAPPVETVPQVAPKDPTIVFKNSCGKSISLSNLMFIGSTSYSLNQTVAAGSDSQALTVSNGCQASGMLSIGGTSNYVAVSPINCSKNGTTYIELKGDQVCPK
ncbi:MAG: hypothetical protein NTV98_04300 [Candidatus Roizmanbacteria bacterium]|nr:hypothetical protein [Candidatus Roizmanbacteria bacterium]